MEWNKEAAHLFGTWNDLQMKAWNDWLRGIQGAMGTSQPTEHWYKTVEVWEQSVKKNLDAQVEWADLWAQSFSSVKDSPDQVAEWARHGQDIVKRWCDTQRQLWDGWFQIVKKLNPVPPGETWEREGQRFTSSWQEMFQKTLEMQSEWMRAWTVGATGDRKKE